MQFNMEQWHIGFFLITMLIIGEIYQAEIKMHSRNILKSQDCLYDQIQFACFAASQDAKRSHSHLTEDMW